MPPWAQRLWSLIRQLQGRVGGTTYTAAFTLAAGAGGSLAVAHGLDGTPSFAYGGVTGSSNVELVTWGWTADATNVVIWVKNHGAVGAVVEVRFRVAL